MYFLKNIVQYFIKRLNVSRTKRLTRENNKMKLNPYITALQISGIRKFMAIANSVENVISLTIGEPDFHTPNHIKEAAKRAIDHNETTYTPNGGKPELRRAAAKYFQEKYALHYDGMTELLVTHGATQALHTTFQTILEPGDEVIIPAPIYPGYAPIIDICQAKVVYVDTRQTQFKLTAKQLKAVITNKTKAVVLPYPNNPTGATLTHEEMHELVQVLQDQPIWIVSDEIYSEICYQQKHISIGHFPAVREQAIIIQGLSKSHAMTGWRIGFLLGPNNLIEQAIKAQQYNITCASSISQAAALEAITNGKEDGIKMCTSYKERGFYLAERLQKMGFTVNPPEGTFYLFANHTKFMADSYEFALFLLHEAKVAVTPGTAFQPFGNGFVRFSFATAQEQIEKACDAMEVVLGKLA